MKPIPYQNVRLVITKVVKFRKRQSGDSWMLDGYAHVTVCKVSDAFVILEDLWKISNLDFVASRFNQISD